jgi:uncharacterized protein
MSARCDDDPASLSSSEAQTKLMSKPLDPVTARAARVYLARIAELYDLAGALLFGSRARHSHRADSDADLAILLRGLRGDFLDTKLDLADIAFDVLLETGVLIYPCRFGKMGGSTPSITALRR